MPCYATTTKPASQAEYKLWQDLGFTGTYDQYAALKRRHAGTRVFVCGDLGPHCADCLDVGENLCDFPVGDGRTCDRAICDAHGREIAPNVHYCNGHYTMWKEFVAAGGVAEELRNVIAFKGA